MQVADIERVVTGGNAQWIVAVFRNLVEVALVETHALAVLEVYCRNDLHDANPRKLRSSRAPSAEDRSG